MTSLSLLLWIVVGIALQVGVDSVRMLRNLVAGQRHGVRTEALGQAARRQARPVALLAACAAREVGQLEGRLPIAAVERADQREQRRVLRDRQRSAVDLRGKYVQRDFDAVVLAMPFSVLRDVEMRGVEMSAWKRQAIDKSEMGDSSRLLVGFSRPYWREAGASGSGKADLPNLQIVLTHVEQLHCDMFESALLPVALTNKLVSLLANPSSQILRAFAKSSVSA